MTNDPCPVTQQRLVESEARQALAIKQRDELARLITEHNNKIPPENDCNHECGKWRQRDSRCYECPRRYLIELPGWLK